MPAGNVFMAEARVAVSLALRSGASSTLSAMSSSIEGSWAAAMPASPPSGDGERFLQNADFHGRMQIARWDPPVHGAN